MGVETIPRIVVTAPKSGSGKTIFTCGLMRLLCRKGKRIAAFKCGPDYIDPMFHRHVLAVDTGNLDTFFTGSDGTKRIFLREAQGAEFAVIEGVMGYYDGLSGEELAASTYDVARTIGAPAVLVIDAKGASVSLAAVIAGMKTFASDSGICGVVLNRVSEAYYPRIKRVIEEKAGITVFGYITEREELTVPSRHLGLVGPEEVASGQNFADAAADEIEAHVDVERLLAVATEEARPVTVSDVQADDPSLPENYRIGVARDAAFSFLYRENLELLQSMGADIVYFSPLADKHLPEGLNAILLPGGYPELFARELSDNLSMRKSIAEAFRNGCRVLAECGGFLYLGETLYDDKDNAYPMVGLLSGSGRRAVTRQRFGYIRMEKLAGHEFHKWEHENPGSDRTILAQGRDDRAYTAMHAGNGILAGFPHYYYESDPAAICRFLTEGKI